MGVTKDCQVYLQRAGLTSALTEQRARGKAFTECLEKPLPGCCETLLLHSPGRAGRDLHLERPGLEQLLYWGIIS